MRVFAFSAVLTGGLAASTSACDLCAIYSASQARGQLGKGPFLGVAEQYTHFGTEQFDGQEVPNLTGQYMNSSISQTFVGYNFNERVGVQFNMPVIHRHFRRPNGEGGIQTGNVAGIGDASLLGNFVPYLHETKQSTLRWDLLGGIKFPTGSPALLEEETQEVENPVGPPSAIHGHDLTLGSGSYDGIVGTGIYTRLKRAFLTANLQYAIRSTGAFDYRFANDLTWAGGPGFYAVLNESYTIALQAIVSGEHKGLDTFEGSPADDTGVTAVYMGPQIIFTWQDKLSAQIAADLPIMINNTALQVVPDYRVRIGVTWHF